MLLILLDFLCSLLFLLSSSFFLLHSSLVILHSSFFFFFLLLLLTYQKGGSKTRFWEGSFVRFSWTLFSGVNKSARERIGRQNLSQKVPSSLGVTFSPRNYRENAHSKSANFEGHLLGRPLLFTSDLFPRPPPPMASFSDIRR